ncbi:MAG: hypothetical protein ACRC7O_14425 [Fimbriiglobus sp.]
MCLSPVRDEAFRRYPAMTAGAGEILPAAHAVSAVTVAEVLDNYLDSAGLWRELAGRADLKRYRKRARNPNAENTTC